LNVYISEGAVIGGVDGWLAREFAPHRMGTTIRDLVDAQQCAESRGSDQGEAAAKVAECDRKLAQYRAALDAGASPATVAGRIAETEAEKARYAVSVRQVAKARERMTAQEIKAVVDKFADLLTGALPRCGSKEGASRGAVMPDGGERPSISLPSQRRGEAGGSLSRGSPGRAGAASTKSRRPGTAGRAGRGE
jgi:hypothetical protein